MHDNIVVLQYLSFWLVSYSSSTNPSVCVMMGPEYNLFEKTVLQTQNLHAV